MPSLRFVRAAPLLVLWMVLVCSFPAHAQGVADAFTVRGVDVDVTAANPQAAKDQAISQGQREAFRVLLERLTAPADHARLPKVDGTQYVRDFSVQSERSSPARYLATLTVRFNPTAVRKLLQGAGIAYAEPRNRSMVVVPVFKTTPTAKPVLWEDANPWRAAWVAQGAGGLVPLVVPAGDTADSQALSVEQAVAGTPEALEALGSRYRTSDVMVAVAALSPGGKNLDVSVIATPGAPKPFDSLTYHTNDSESTEAMIARAASDMARAVDTVFKQPNLLQFDRAASLSTLVPLAGMEDWMAVRERLARVPQVRRWELVSLSKAEAALVLHIVGDQEQVKAALGNAGLQLDWGDGFWVMRPVGSRK